MEKPTLHELIVKAKCGDQEAISEIVTRFIPIIRKYSRQLGYEEAYSDLVEWMVRSINRYQATTTELPDH